MSRDSEPRGAVILTALAALGLQLLPLPEAIALFRPAFVVLAVIFWSLNRPRAGGIAVGFLTGLALDVFKGTVLGQYALATSLIAYVTIRQHLLLRNKPVLQQTLFVAVMLLLWELVIWAIDGWTGQTSAGIGRWLDVPTSVLCWPAIAALLRRTYVAR
ncbi:MAG: rod shape-determining protein MreD [Steroidobacteraceae bacterium]|nr:rod shape-determining protein MreD [Nevskiaceae bacterium]MCP5472845.1 rod shape-determining protein MreD [Nevskiaceae bacterium]